MNPRTALSLSTVLLFLTALPLPAVEAPGILSHQGRIAVGGVNYDGTGFFKFALVKGDPATETLWTNDGTGLGTPGGEPTGSVTTTVSKGHYAVVLGDAPMEAIAASVFADNADVRLRIWFSTDDATFEQLSPDRRIASVGYALIAAGIPGLTAVDDKIGIGTETPESLGKLHVFSPTGNRLTVEAGNASFAGVRTKSSLGEFFAGNWNSNWSVFDYVAGSERFSITATGNVGIGVTDPSTRLEVDGAVTATAFRGPVNEPPTDVFPVNGMVWIKPGTFLMGSRTDEPGRGSDESQHAVTLTKGFWMSVHEVTQAEYVAVTGLANPSSFTGDTNRPVETVSHTSAVAYCTTLTTAELAAGRIPSDWEYRLPTEAEWEYCCRAGARTTRFGYGDDIGTTALSDYAWHSSNSAGATHPVEQKRANPWGLMDMHGDVWEWCQDWYGAYLPGSATDPQGPATGSDRVLRGGSWGIVSQATRCAFRSNISPGFTSGSIGFRAVLAPGQP